MKRYLKQNRFWLTAAALVLLVSVNLPRAMAYFTTCVAAEGGYPVTLSSNATIEEEVEDMTKHIVLSNTGQCDCYVRVKVFSGSQFTIQYAGAVDDEKKPYWNFKETDGYWYYRDIVPKGKETEVLQAKIEVPKDWKETFDIIVIQECTPVLYEADGTPYADWEHNIDTKTDIGTIEGEETLEE